MRQFQFRVGHDNFALVYVSLIPVIGGEQKTKPTQAGVRDLRGLGLLPDLVSYSRFLMRAEADDFQDRLSMRASPSHRDHGESVDVLPRHSQTGRRRPQRLINIPRPAPPSRPRFTGISPETAEFGRGDRGAEYEGEGRVAHGSMACYDYRVSGLYMFADSTD